jgi:hypothetical protein
MAFQENLSIFFNTDYSSIEATISGGAEPVIGLFDKEYVDIEVGGIPVSGYMPVFRCAESDVSGILKGATVVIDSVDYKVVIPKPDGTGVIDLVLEKQ